MYSALTRKLATRFQLSECDKHALDRISTNKIFSSSRRDLFEEGDILDCVFFINSGFACKHKILPHGSRAILGYIIPGDTCAFHDLLLDRIDYTVATMTKCEVAMISRQDLDRLMNDRPSIGHAFYISEMVDVAISRQWLTNIGRRSTSKRVAHLLCELFFRLQIVNLTTNDGFELPITQYDLGDATGLTSIHINRVLRNLRDQKLIVIENKFAHIPNLNRLQAFAEFNANYLHIDVSENFPVYPYTKINIFRSS